MPTEKPGPCNPACTNIIKFYTDKEIPPSTGISKGTYTNVDGYRYINVFLQFSQQAASEPPVDLGVIFAFDANGTVGARQYVNLEANVPASQAVNMINVSGAGTWHGSPHNISSYVVRLPIMGPFVDVFPFNQAKTKRQISVWAYLVS